MTESPQMFWFHIPVLNRLLNALNRLHMALLKEINFFFSYETR